MIYLYAIIDRPGLVFPSLSGLENAPVSQLVVGKIAGVFASLPSGITPTSLTVDEENLWKHESVLEVLMLDHSLLPLRYGTFFENTSELLDLLEKKYDRFAADLLRVEGCVELSLHLKYPEETLLQSVLPESSQEILQKPTINGKEYMQTLMNKRNQENATQLKLTTEFRDLLEKLNLMVIESTQSITLDPLPNLKAAFLIHKKNLPDFQQEVETLSNSRKDLKFALTGPWPPYSFITN
ncbi:MAG: GvpL/GvpF family gas vesicle protein [Chloroflexi bacterium]|nr:GvpL/GvpF family gas vesicle protein [Chloroflexota bacterium]